jgi:hypothetical protein
MYVKWHLKGDCYDNCARVVSHVTNDNIPNKKQAEFPLQVPQGDSQEEIILTAWVGAQWHPTTKEATRPTFPVGHGQEATKSINRRSKQ